MPYLTFSPKRIDTGGALAQGLQGASDTLGTAQQLNQQRERHQAALAEIQRRQEAERAAGQYAATRLNQERGRLMERYAQGQDEGDLDLARDLEQLQAIAPRLDERGREALFADYRSMYAQRQQERRLDSLRTRLNVAERQGLFSINPDETVQVNDGAGGMSEVSVGQQTADAIYGLAEAGDLDAAEDLFLETVERVRQQKYADQVREDTVAWADSQVLKQRDAGVPMSQLMEARARLSEFQTFGGDPEEFRQDFLRAVHGIKDRPSVERDVENWRKARMDFAQSIARDVTSDKDMQRMLAAWDQSFPDPRLEAEQRAHEQQLRAQQAAAAAPDAFAFALQQPGQPQAPDAGALAVAEQPVAQPQQQAAPRDPNGRRGLVGVSSGDDPRLLDLERTRAGERIDPESRNVRNWPAAKQLEALQAIMEAIDSAETPRAARSAARRAVDGATLPEAVRKEIEARIKARFELVDGGNGRSAARKDLAQPFQGTGLPRSGGGE